LTLAFALQQRKKIDVDDDDDDGGGGGGGRGGGGGGGDNYDTNITCSKMTLNLHMWTIAHCENPVYQNNMQHCSKIFANNTEAVTISNPIPSNKFHSTSWRNSNSVYITHHPHARYMGHMHYPFS
jgi:hypothetical protein